jgi:hypothetical protein
MSISDIRLDRGSVFPPHESNAEELPALKAAWKHLPELQDLGTQSGECWNATVLPNAVETADATAKLVFRNQAGRPRAILICSNPVAPGAIATAVAAAAHAKTLLEGNAKEAILDPLATGVVDGLSYALYTWCLPLSNHRLLWPLQRRSLRPRLLQWLREVLQATRRDVSDGAVEQSFLAPLRYVADAMDLDPAIRHAATLASKRLCQGQWRPKFVLAHNDLWKGNILLGGPPSVSAWSGQRPFVVIDWVGSCEKGLAIYDLVRLADSLRMRQSALAGEIREHCTLLDCDPIDSRGYLLASLGMLRLWPGDFSRNRYLQLVSDCCAKLFPALHGLPIST